MEQLDDGNNTSIMYLLEWCEDVWVSTFFEGLNGPGFKQLKMGETVPTFMYGGCTLQGDRIEMLGAASMKYMQSTGIKGTCLYKINGIVYEFLI